MKKIRFLILLFVSCMAHTHAQVGINTTSPLVSLHVEAEKTDGTTPEGIIAPKLTRAQLTSKDAQYTVAHNGTFVYVTTIDGTASAKTTNVTTIGYYYFDGGLNIWKHFNDKIQTADNGLNVSSQAHVQLGGNLVKNTIIDTKTNTLTISNTGGTNTGLQLAGGGAAAGKVLTSDATGNATWNMPGFSVYESIPYQLSTFNGDAEFVDSGFYFDFPSPGVYAVNLGITINSANGFFVGNDAYWPAIQLIPKLASSTTADVETSWKATSPRFLGSYELFGSNPFSSSVPGTTYELRFAYNQNITVTDSGLSSDTGLRAYLIFYFPAHTPGEVITMIIGNNPGTTRPQSSGGSFIRIN